MNRKLTIYTLLFFLLASTPALPQNATAIKTLYNTVSNTYETEADSLTNCFIEKFMNKTKGIFNEKPGVWGQYIYWQQAHAIDVLIYAYERHKGDDTGLSSKYAMYIRRWYTSKGNNYSSGTTGFENPYTDDMCWICLTLMHMGDALGTTTYHTTAKRLFDNAIMARAVEDGDDALWLPWNTDAGSGPNACTLSPACLIAVKMYQKHGDAKYLEYAEKFYNYMVRNIVKPDGRVEEPPLTYTQGTFGEACRLLYHLTEKSTQFKNKYKTNAFTYINYAFTSGRCTNGNNILRHEGTSMDQSIFKAVLMPYAVNFVQDTEMSVANRRTIATYIQKNAKTMWQTMDTSRYPTVFCNYDWTKPYTGEDKDASMGAMASGASLMENTARMCKKIVDDYDDYMDGIDVAEAASLDAEGNAYGVFTLNGRLVRTPWQATTDLPSGIYVINGRKVLLNGR